MTGLKKIKINITNTGTRRYDEYVSLLLSTSKARAKGGGFNDFPRTAGGVDRI